MITRPVKNSTELVFTVRRLEQKHLNRVNDFLFLFFFWGGGLGGGVEGGAVDLIYAVTICTSQELK